MPQRNPHIIVSGGGTGGHIFPALAIARALKEMVPESEILFIGAIGKMEMEKVPAAGFPIKGLWISGLRRDLSPGNLLFPLKLAHSLLKAMLIIRRFKADVAVGVGGFASGPAIRAASMLRVPTLILEQNSYPGITNIWLGKVVTRICVAYEGMDKYFPSEKIIKTGNPVRKDMIEVDGKRDEAGRFFGLDPEKPTVLVIGGSQGALSINRCIEGLLPRLKEKGTQVIWQTGKTFYPQAREASQTKGSSHIRVVDFIQRMDLAYALADVVISRAGAIAIAELAIVGKPVIFIPLPTAAEDHQTKNARQLADSHSAILLQDKDAPKFLEETLYGLLADAPKREELGQGIKKFATRNADLKVAEEVIKLIRKRS
jgi:UDP-N-acetylglucosamine--N-acetylmuramyl-(pentapeptide) pyrophosphoryl-undecaprenol N-acetylglucosamine transferase